MADENLGIETLLNLVDVKPERFRYILCHPSVEGRIRYMDRVAESSATVANRSDRYSGLEIVSHPNMLIEHCLAISTLEELNRVLEFLDACNHSTPMRIKLWPTA